MTCKFDKASMSPDMVLYSIPIRLRVDVRFKLPPLINHIHIHARNTWSGGVCVYLCTYPGFVSVCKTDFPLTLFLNFHYRISSLFFPF